MITFLSSFKNRKCFFIFTAKKPLLNRFEFYAKDVFVLEKCLNQAFCFVFSVIRCNIVQFPGHKKKVIRLTCDSVHVCLQAIKRFDLNIDQQSTRFLHWLRIWLISSGPRNHVSFKKLKAS